MLMELHGSRSRRNDLNMGGSSGLDGKDGRENVSK